LSLNLNRTPTYAVCWPGTARAAGSPGSRAGKLILTTLRDGDRPRTASRCGAGRYCICLNAGGDVPASALIVELPHAPGIHIAGCLILAEPISATGQAPGASPIVTLRL